MEFGKDYQHELLARLSDVTLLTHVASQLRPSFFTPPLNEVVKELLAHFRKHRKPLSWGQLAQLAKRHGVTLARPEDGDHAFDEAEIRLFGQTTMLREALVQAVAHNQAGQPEKAVELIREVPKKWPRNHTVDDADILLQGRTIPQPRNVLPTGLPQLDETLQGGIWGGDVAVMMGPTGGGKSAWLVWVASHAVKLGKKVWFVTLEMPDFEIEARMRHCILGVPKEKNRKLWDLDIKKYRKKGAELHVLEFPPGSVSAEELDNMIPRDADVIIIDYADHLRVSGGNTSIMYLDLGRVYLSLKAMSMERCIPVWTASQVNRASYGADVFETKDVEASMQKAMVSDRVLTLSQNSAGRIQDEKSGLSSGTIFVAKNRKGRAFQRMDVTIHFGMNHFTEGKWAE